jgi:hypothetical protein
VIREWVGPDGEWLDAPRVVGVELGRELRDPHSERRRYAWAESLRVAKRRVRRR